MRGSLSAGRSSPAEVPSETGLLRTAARSEALLSFAEERLPRELCVRIVSLYLRERKLRARESLASRELALLYADCNIYDPLCLYWDFAFGYEL